MSDASRRSSSNSVFESVHFLARRNAHRLEARRDKCVEQAQYKEASKMHYELERMLQDHECMEAEKIQIKQMQEHLKIINEQAKELAEFNGMWTTRMQEFNRRIEFLRASFKKDQRDAHRQHIKDIRSVKPALTTSKPLQSMRNQAASLAKLEKFAEADFIKKEADRFEQREVVAHQAKCDNISRLGGKETFTKSQSMAKEQFESKIELDWMRMNVARRAETEEMLKRQLNQRYRCMEKQKVILKEPIPPLIVKEANITSGGRHALETGQAPPQTKPKMTRSKSAR